jgi:hypothetical protein
VNRLSERVGLDIDERCQIGRSRYYPLASINQKFAVRILKPGISPCPCLLVQPRISVDWFESHGVVKSATMEMSAASHSGAVVSI